MNLILAWMKAYDLYCDAKRRLEGAEETGIANLIDAMMEALNATKANLDLVTKQINIESKTS